MEGEEFTRVHQEMIKHFYFRRYQFFKIEMFTKMYLDEVNDVLDNVSKEMPPTD